MTDFYVKAVHYSTNYKGNQVIFSAKVCPNSNGYFGAERIWSRMEIINAIENQRKNFKTVYKRNGTYYIGYDVLVIDVDGEKYIRTDSNRKTIDNLGEIEEF